MKPIIEVSPHPSKFHYAVLENKSVGELCNMLQDGKVFDRPYTRYNLTDEEKAEVIKAISFKCRQFETDIEYEVTDEDGNKTKKRKFADCTHDVQQTYSDEFNYCLNCFKKVKRIKK